MVKPILYKEYAYQRFGREQILANPYCGAFMDMGLGKTVMTLTAIDQMLKSKTIKNVLIIAPLKVAQSVWSDEIEKWKHLNHLTISKVLGTAKQRKEGLARKADIHIINRENIVWLVELLGGEWHFDFMCIDELSSFKGEKSKRFRALKIVRPKIKRVVGLTGTPAPNGMLDLWSQLFLLDRGERLGKSFPRYRAKYFDAGNGRGDIVYNYTLKQGDDILGEEFYNKEIYEKIGDICFSMKTEDYVELPDRLDIVRNVEMPPNILRQYREFEEAAVLELLERDTEITAINAAALSNKLLQFSNGAVYDEDKNYHVVHDEKIEALKEVMDEVQGDNVLLFYAYKSDKARIMKQFKYARELKTPEDMKDWNDGKIKMLIAHPQSAGHGLNLQFGGKTIVWFGLPWSLEFYQQAVKRIHRKGVDGVVRNIMLVNRFTLDAEVLKRLEGKAHKQNSLLSAVAAIVEKYRK